MIYRLSNPRLFALLVGAAIMFDLILGGGCDVTG